MKAQQNTSSRIVEADAADVRVIVLTAKVDGLSVRLAAASAHLAK